MKKIIKCATLIGMLFASSVIAANVPVQLSPIIDEGAASSNSTKAPIRPMTVWVDGNVITMQPAASDITIQLYDEDGELVFSGIYYEGTTQVVLPSSLSGTYELYIIPDDCYYYYWGYLMF